MTSNYAHVHRDPGRDRLMLHVAPPMSAPCVCGARFGMHRVKDHACPNQKWSPGNGQPQWLQQNWKRA